MLVRSITDVRFAPPIKNFKNTNFNHAGMQNMPNTINQTSIPLSTLHSYNNISFKSVIKDLYERPEDAVIKEENFVEKFNWVQSLLKTEAKEESSWINLPSKLLEDGSVDKVYQTVEEFKKPIGENPHLIFVALGNPANADEAAKALGFGDNVTYCCAVRESEIKHAIQKSGGNLEKIQVMISSKSGTTFESNTTYQFLHKQFENFYKNKGFEGEELKKQISKHFLCLTDKNPSAKLKKEAIERGYKTIDCIDGLASGFGDLAYDMPLLAYAGLSEEDAIKMLKAAENITKETLENPLEKNLAGKIAVFDRIAKRNGVLKEQFIFHDTGIDFTNTIAQLYRESLRKTDLELNTYPRSAHSGLQSAIDSKLDWQKTNNITNIIPLGGDKTQSALNLEIAHIKNATNEGHWQKILGFELKSDGSGITPETLGEFLMLKSFIAYFKNYLEGTNHNMQKIDYVNGYKAIFKDLQDGCN